MQQKDQAKLDRAVRVLLNMGEVPSHKLPKFTKEDLRKKFKIKVSRSGKGEIQEI